MKKLAMPVAAIAEAYRRRWPAVMRQRFLDVFLFTDRNQMVVGQWRPRADMPGFGAAMATGRSDPDGLVAKRVLRVSIWPA